MNKREIHNKLWHSLDMRYVWSWVLVCAIALAVTALAGQAVVGALMCLPFVGYALWRMLRIFRKAKSYEFHRARLVQPYAEFWRGMYSFTAILEDQSRVMHTGAIFSVRSLLLPQMQDYVNQTVTIAYNPETEMVVVIE